MLEPGNTHDFPPFARFRRYQCGCDIVFGIQATGCAVGSSPLGKCCPRGPPESATRLYTQRHMVTRHNGQILYIFV